MKDRLKLIENLDYYRNNYQKEWLRNNELEKNIEDLRKLLSHYELLLSIKDDIINNLKIQLAKANIKKEKVEKEMFKER